MFLKSTLCIVAFGICLTSAQLCPLLLKDGECVADTLPCAPGKTENMAFNCGSENLKCCYTPPTPLTTTTTTPAPPQQPACGERSLSNRIFAGTDTGDACKWPWAVNIRARTAGEVGPPTPDNTLQICNGVLVRPNLVVTSASCIHTASLFNGLGSAEEALLVVAGEYNTNTYDIFDNQIRERFGAVEAAYLHPAYFKSDSDILTVNDFTNVTIRKPHNVGVLKLKYDVDLGNCRELACLPTMEDIAEQAANNVFQRQCHIASWGRFDASQADAVVLKEGEVDIYPSGICPLIDPNFPSGGTTCGRVRGNIGICTGDDGAMIVCQNPVSNKYVLFGLVNFPETKLCNASVPYQLLTFSDIRDPTTMSWIQDIINNGSP